MAATRTSRFTGTRSQTSGAVKPPSNWATTTRSARVRDDIHHGVRVLREPSRVVIARKIRRHHVVPPLTQLGLHQVPVPPDVARAVDQDERCQQLAYCPLSRVPVEDSHGPNSIRPDGIVMESLLPLPGLMRLDRFERLGRSLSLSRSRTLLRRSG